VPYAYLIETGLGAFLVSGAFLGRAYFDLFYQLVALTVILSILARQEGFQRVQSPQLSNSEFAADTQDEVVI
jgi:hypothetical protein